MHLVHDQDLGAHEHSTSDAEELAEPHIEIGTAILNHCIEAVGKRLDNLILDIHLIKKIQMSCKQPLGCGGEGRPSRGYPRYLCQYAPQRGRGSS